MTRGATAGLEQAVFGGPKAGFGRFQPFVTVPFQLNEIHYRLIWVVADVFGPFSIIVGSFSRNVGRRQQIFSANVVPYRPMLSGPADYVLGPLHLG